MTEKRIFKMARQVASALVGSNIICLSFNLCVCLSHPGRKHTAIVGFLIYGLRCSHLSLTVITTLRLSTFILWHCLYLNTFKEYLHTQRCIHGNVGARSVLVGGDLTAKLWGLGSAYRRRTQPHSPGEVEDMELKKWQAPEVLSRRMISQSSDVWVHQSSVTAWNDLWFQCLSDSLFILLLINVQISQNVKSLCF